MLDVNIKNRDYWYTVEISDGSKKLIMTFGGNLDLSFSCYDNNRNDKEKLVFEITKDSYLLYELFDELYNDIKNCNIFKDFINDVSFYDEEEYKDLMFERESLNDMFRNKEAYNDIFDGYQVRWYSDDESCNLFTMTPGEDKYVLEFISGYKISYLDEFSVRFRNSGSRYDPFNFLFMNLFNKIISGDYDFDQMHINEYVRKRVM